MNGLAIHPDAFLSRSYWFIVCSIPSSAHALEEEEEVGTVKERRKKRREEEEEGKKEKENKKVGKGSKWNKNTIT